ncbi:PREDICTED: uncharacterized protein LOC109157434 [Ipomoea nil]|uniref:uncharacterized protein LOC109157434 n=1 Tax=Ipomoea nil TaxID=35883 RepID=UPI00090155FF|nr:PREDICTED: uncharacterized protein LOC109157434 [Ipomoea nil]
MEETSVITNNPIIFLSDEVKERIRKPWRRSLIIRVLGIKVGYSYLMQRLQKMWRPEANFELITLNYEHYIVRFESLRDYEFAKFEGPWSILDHYVIVQEWVPDFSPRNNKTEKLLAWVRFPDLPVEYFEERFLRKIARKIGRPIKIDSTTSLISKGSFARVCVELDISKPLLSKFTLQEEVWPVEYEGLHLVCFNCGLYGHRQNQCGKNNDQGSQEAPVTNINQEQGDRISAETTNAPPNQHEPPKQDYSADYGSWMLVSRRDRRGPRRGDN